MTEIPTRPSIASSVDLHTHSTVSDGLLSPAALVREAARRGIRTLALTDHDTLDGLPVAISEAAACDIELIPGVELSAETSGHEVHILGYFVTRDDPTLRAALAELAEQRVARNRRMVVKLNELGIPISFDRVRDIAGSGTIGRPHIARALIECGYVQSMPEAFERYLATGRPAFVPRAESNPERSVHLLRRARAVPVLAHPLTTGDIEGTLERLVPAGLLGLEVYYGEYSTETHAELARIAANWDLVATGGSDYHGPIFKSGRELGSAPVPESVVRDLRQRWEVAKNQ